MHRLTQPRSVQQQVNHWRAHDWPSKRVLGCTLRAQTPRSEGRLLREHWYAAPTLKRWSPVVFSLETRRCIHRLSPCLPYPTSPSSPPSPSRARGTGASRPIIMSFPAGTLQPLSAQICRNSTRQQSHSARVRIGEKVSVAARLCMDIVSQKLLFVRAAAEGDVIFACGTGRAPSRKCGQALLHKGMVTSRLKRY
eukprot:6176096-Pleurochrysis_carterae.AAC.2